MRVISLYQPYATLVVLGLKQFETRGWDTKVRGPLAIHATAGFPAWAKKQCFQEPFRSALAKHGFTADNLPKGVIVGTVELVDTQRTDLWIGERLAEPGVIEQKWSDEYYFGDYSGGRFAWQLRNPVKFGNPVYAKGSQGFWSFDLTGYTHGQLGISVPDGKLIKL